MPCGTASLYVSHPPLPSVQSVALSRLVTHVNSLELGSIWTFTPRSTQLDSISLGLRCTTTGA